MKIASAQYLGDLRIENTHLRSKKTVLTDAPIDNNGKGEAFSPTDLVATALADCTLTVMAIKARDMGIDLIGCSMGIEKVMGTEPRRIIEVIIDINLPNFEVSDTDKLLLEKVARLCPVAKSLHPDLQKTIRFHWQ